MISLDDAIEGSYIWTPFTSLSPCTGCVLELNQNDPPVQRDAFSSLDLLKGSASTMAATVSSLTVHTSTTASLSTSLTSNTRMATTASESLSNPVVNQSGAPSHASTSTPMLSRPSKSGQTQKTMHIALDTGAAVGISISITVVVIMSIGIAVFVYRRRQSRSRTERHADESSNTFGTAARNEERNEEMPGVASDCFAEGLRESVLELQTVQEKDGDPVVRELETYASAHELNAGDDKQVPMFELAES